jgi:hypothetical protein
VRPSGFWYLVPVVLLLAGGVAAILGIVSGFRAYSDTIEGFARVPVGSSGTIEIDGTGGYTVFYEPGGMSEESELERGTFEPTVQLSTSDGAPVELRDYASWSTYSASGYVGFAMRTFRVEQPGRYELTTTEGAEGTIAVGRSPFSKLGTGVLRGLALGTAGFLVAVVVWIVLLVTRGRAKRRMRAAAWAAGPQLAWGGGYPASPPGYPAGPPGGYPSAAPGSPAGPTWPHPPAGSPSAYPPGPYPGQPAAPGHPPAPGPSPSAPGWSPPTPPPAGPSPAPPGSAAPPGWTPPPPASPPAPPPAVAPDDDTTPGWGQPGR